MSRNNVLRIDRETLERLKQTKRELSSLEKKDLAMGEIISRMMRSDDILERLKLGAMERRRGLR
jgi:hypothetical protein